MHIVIARGRRSEILDWGKGRVLKLYLPGWPRAVWAGEAETTRWLHEQGLPVPAVYGTLELDGRLGILMERVDGPSISDVLEAHPERLLELARTMAEVHARLHDARPPERAMPLGRLLAYKIGSPQSPLSPRQKEAILAALETIPDGDTLCHGDFHPRNVLVPPDRPPVVIDWDAATRGNPLGDVARTVLTLRASSCYALPGNWDLLSVISRGIEIYLERYFELRPDAPDDLERWLWINAAARLYEGIAEEETWLLNQVERGFADRSGPPR